MNARFNMDDYDTVESRIRKFWADHPAGRVLTDLIHRDDRQYIVRADIYTDRDDPRPAATGYAEEVVGSSPVNKTAALENCETSAIGRGLANLNYATKARPSREEMEKSQRRQAPEQVEPADPAVQARRALAATCAENSWDPHRVGVRFASEHRMSLGEATDAAVIERFRKSLFNVSDADLRAPATNGAAQ